MKKIYIAASLDAKLFAQVITRCLERENLAIEIVSSWTDKDTGYSRGPGMLLIDAEQDYEDLESVDILIHLCPSIRSSRGGADTELGIALGLGKEVIVFGEPVSIFHYLERVKGVTHYRDLVLYIEQISGKEVAL